MSRLSRRWPHALDAAVDGLLVVFAFWTVVYQVALATGTSLLPLSWPLLLTLLGLPLTTALRAIRDVESDVLAQATPATPLPGMNSTTRWPLLVVVAVVTILLAGRSWWGVWPAAIASMLIVLRQLVALYRRPDEVSDRSPTGGPSAAAHLIAACTSAGLAVLSCFLLHPDADDVYYVNRATWVASRGTAAGGDTIFSANELPTAFGSGIQTPSIEAAQGILAHTLHISAPGLCYLVVGPALSFVVGWTIWRLIRSWAERNLVLAFLTSVVFLLASGQSIVGNYTISRIWQGKVIAYCILLPLVWLALSQVTRRIRRSDVVYLSAAGVCFVGLTTSSTVMAPVVFVSAALAALLLRSPSLLIGATCFLIGPLVNAGVQILFAPSIAGGGENATLTPAAAFELTFGRTLPIVVLGVAAMVLAVRLPVGTTGCLLGCGAAVSFATYIPGLFALAGAVTGAGAVVWRLAITMPIWALVGLLPTLRIDTSRPVHHQKGPGRCVAHTCFAMIVLAVPALSGTWLWDRSGTQLTSRPTWKVDQTALSDVRAASLLKVPPGRWLLPPTQMQILSLSTVEQFAVVPRDFYLPTLQVSATDRQERMILLSLVSGQEVASEQVRGAMARLRVGIACVPRNDLRARSILLQATRSAEETFVGHMACHVGRVRIPQR